MDFDQMLETWKAQDSKPLYEVNQDLLRLMLLSEQAKVRRTMLLGQWINLIVGGGMALFAAFWLWLVVVTRGPPLQTIAGAVSTGAFALWVGTFWVSRRRQARRERAFGNTLKDEINRSLSLVEFQISNGRWQTSLLWTAPVLIGALLINWLSFQINTDTGLSTWDQVWLTSVPVWAVAAVTYAGHRHVKRKLEPRRQRLRELLESLDAGE